MGKKGIISSFVMLMVLLLNLTATTLFIHSHYVDGQKVTHSHFYAGPAAEHSHSKSHILYLDDSLQCDAILAEVVRCDNVTTIAHIIDYKPLLTEVTEPDCVVVSLRAPPAVA
ncbi:MAG: hypothetical protein J6C56_07055 [Alistipes sp.]|nr:hypothetical protein [Alistipes sp.]